MDAHELLVSSLFASSLCNSDPEFPWRGGDGYHGNWQQAAETHPDVTENRFTPCDLLCCFANRTWFYMFTCFFPLLLSPPASPPSTSSAETSHSDWPSDALTPQCLLLFLGLPVKYPLSQGSSSGCSLPCCFSHYWLASHSLFFFSFFLFFIIVPGLFVNLRRVSTNQSNLLTKTSEERKAQFAPSS